MAICGKDCSITVDGSGSFEGHSFTIDTNSDETDVRAFGSGDYGEWLACAKNGTITINSYLNPGVTSGDTADIVAVIGTPAVLTITANSCKCTNYNISVDAKGIVEFSTTFRLTGDISGV